MEKQETRMGGVGRERVWAMQRLREQRMRRQRERDGEGRDGTREEETTKRAGRAAGQTMLAVLVDVGKGYRGR